MNASTCARTLYVPWREGMTKESLRKEAVELALRQKALEDEQGTGGSGLHYE